MSRNNSRKMMGASLHVSICLLGILSLFAIPANAQHVHQLLYNNYNWTDQNLVGEPAGSNDPYPTGNAAFTTTPNNEVHVYYVGSDADIHQRTQSHTPPFFGVSRWVDEDLTQETGAEPVGLDIVTMLSGFSEGNYQYVFYGNDDYDIHMLLYDNSKWTQQDISAAAGSTGIFRGMSVVGFTTTPNNQIHVYYLGWSYQEQANAVRQLFFNGTSWSDEDLTAETGATPPSYGWWAGFSIGNYQYLFYPDFFGYLHELYYNNSNWTDVDLSVQIGAPALSIDYAPMTAFVVPGTQTMEVFYTDSDDHIYQISSSDNISWSQQDLTTLTHSPSTSSEDAITAFATTPNNQLHVYYISSSSQSLDHVNQLFFNGSSWSNQDLTATSHAGNAVELEAISGFSLGNYQYVYYVGK